MSLASTAAMVLLSPRNKPTENCTLATCDILNSFYEYRPSLPANAAFAAIFTISLAAFVTQGILSKRFIGFSIAMALGTFGEAVGYGGRVMMYNNPWKKVRRQKSDRSCAKKVN